MVGTACEHVALDQFPASLSLVPSLPFPSLPCVARLPSTAQPSPEQGTGPGVLCSHVS